MTRTSVLGCGLALLVLSSCSCQHLPAVVTKDHRDGDKHIEMNWDLFPNDMVNLHRVLLADPSFVVEPQEPAKSLDPKLPLEQCLAYPPELRFAWTSDAQMRQREAKLYGEKLSSKLDTIVQSFQRNEMQEEYDWAVYLSVITAFDRINAAEEAKPAPSYLRFLIHTGDAMDGGFIQELWQFLSITNTSRLPWFNVVGNHDGSVFGNYSRHVTFTKEAFSDFFPVAGMATFLGMHSTTLASVGEFVGHLPRPLGMDNDETVTGEVTLERRTDEGRHARLESTPGSRCHGFDLRGTATNNESCADQPGYYSFEVEPNTVVVVLASPRTSTWGAGSKWKESADENDSASERQEAEATAKQITWLRETLGSYRRRNILVFSHHRMKDGSSELKSILDEAAQKNALAVFTGHTHDDDLTKYSNYYDINLASIISYPQMGRVIDIRRDPQTGKGCLVSKPVLTSSFREAFAIANPVGSRSAVDKMLETCDATRSLVRDLRVSDRLGKCEADPEACASYLAETRSALRDAIRCGHLGTMRDFLGRRGAVPRLEPEVTQFAIPLDLPGEN